MGSVGPVKTGGSAPSPVGPDVDIRPDDLTMRYDAPPAVVPPPSIALADYQARKVVLKVPPGNRRATIANDQMSRNRTREEERKGHAEGLADAVENLRKAPQLVQEIKRAAALYDVPAEALIGCLLAERTLNWNWAHNVQSWLAPVLPFTSKIYSNDFRSQLKRPEFAPCNAATSSYDRWACYQDTWETSMRGKNGNSDDRFMEVAFGQFLAAGHSVGVFRMQPATMLQASDLVHAKSGFPNLTLDDPAAILRAAEDSMSAVHYLAAVLRLSIDEYARTAGFDISGNPGLLVTLYNIGQLKHHAQQRYDATLGSLRQGRPLEWPQENWFGWFINDKLPLIQKLLASSGQ